MKLTYICHIDVCPVLRVLLALCVSEPLILGLPYEPVRLTTKYLMSSLQELELADGDYANDVGEEWDPIEDETSSTSRPILGVTPSAFTRLDVSRLTTIDPVAATNERPRILEDCK